LSKKCKSKKVETPVGKIERKKERKNNLNEIGKETKNTKFGGTRGVWGAINKGRGEVLCKVFLGGVVLFFRGGWVWGSPNRLGETRTPQNQKVKKKKKAGKPRVKIYFCFLFFLENWGKGFPPLHKPKPSKQGAQKSKEWNPFVTRKLGKRNCLGENHVSG